MSDEIKDKGRRRTAKENSQMTENGRFIRGTFRLQAGEPI